MAANQPSTVGVWLSTVSPEQHAEEVSHGDYLSTQCEMEVVVAVPGGQEAESCQTVPVSSTDDNNGTLFNTSRQENGREDMDTLLASPGAAVTAMDVHRPTTSVKEPKQTRIDVWVAREPVPNVDPPEIERCSEEAASDGNKKPLGLVQQSCAALEPVADAPEAMVKPQAVKSKAKAKGANSVQTRQQCDWRVDAKRLLEDMVAMSDSEPFRLPVDLAAYPDYTAHVRTPMDLFSIAKSLDEEDYGFASFVQHMRLIFENSRAYNTDTMSPIRRMTASLSRFFEARLRSQLPYRVLRRRPEKRKRQNKAAEPPATSVSTSCNSQLASSTSKAQASKKSLPPEPSSIPDPPSESGTVERPSKRRRQVASAKPRTKDEGNGKHDEKPKKNEKPKKKRLNLCKTKTKAKIKTKIKTKQGQRPKTKVESTVTSADPPSPERAGLPPPSTPAEKAARRKLRKEQLRAWRIWWERELREERQARRQGLLTPRITKVTFSNSTVVHVLEAT